MAQNNVTEVVNGIVQPRFYQVYGDLIESKEVMEPLAIMAGTGPFCGFDWGGTSQQEGRYYQTECNHNQCIQEAEYITFGSG